MEGIGSKLRAARLRWQLTLREVEDRSLLLSKHLGNPACRISASRLLRVEKGMGDLSAPRLIVLASIYGLSANEMLALFPTTSSKPAKPEQVAGPNATLLLQKGPLAEHAKLWLPESLVSDPPPEETVLLPYDEETLPSHYRRGIIGRKDRTLEPMIRAGSIVLIDTNRRAIANRREWNHEFDRPIYFLLSHSGYVSGFCELDTDEKWLTLVPHPLSHESSSRWRYRKEIEVIGTITAVCMRRGA